MTPSRSTAADAACHRLAALAEAVDGLRNRHRQLLLTHRSGDEAREGDAERALQHVRGELARREGELGVVLAHHPAWTWLETVDGVCPVLAAKLLARLALDETTSAHALRERCGLTTVEGHEFRCPRCGATTTRPAEATGAVRCRCGAEMAAARASQVVPHAARDVAAGVDPVARALVRRLAGELLEAGGAYAAVYRAEADKLARTRRDWPEHRRHLTAMRRVQQRFLVHLWRAWREAMDLRVDRDAATDPWAMSRTSSPKAVSMSSHSTGSPRPGAACGSGSA